MIQITPQMRILVAVEAVDFRKGIDGLVRIARVEMKTDPFSGTLYIFRNRRATSVKLLVYDGQGFWLCHKRLSTGRFRWWPGAEEAQSIEAHQVQLLLWNGNPHRAESAPMWRRVSPHV